MHISPFPAVNRPALRLLSMVACFSSPPVARLRTTSVKMNLRVPCSIQNKEFFMPRPVTMFTGQWADLPLEELAKKFKQFRLRWPRIGLLGRSLPNRSRLGRARLLRMQARIAGAQRASGLGDQQSPCRPGRAGRDRRAAPGHPAAARLGRRQSGRRQRAGGRGNEERGPRGAEAGRDRGQRFHRFEHLAVALFLPAGLAADDRRRLQTAGRALEPDSRRVRRMRREVCPGSPSHGDRFRSLHGRAAPWKPSDIARSSASTSIPAI